MHLTKYIRKYKIPTCFGTVVPSTGSYMNKGTQGQHAYAGTVSPVL
jgi:hypothetical protein